MRDAIADVLVTTYGMAHVLGIDADADMATVQASNLSKLCKPSRKLIRHLITTVKKLVCRYIPVVSCRRHLLSQLKTRPVKTASSTRPINSLNALTGTSQNSVKHTALRPVPGLVARHWSYSNLSVSQKTTLTFNSPGISSFLLPFFDVSHHTIRS